MARGHSATKPYQVDSKRRVGLAPEAADALGVKPGDFVTYEVDGKTVRVRKVDMVVR